MASPSQEPDGQHFLLQPGDSCPSRGSLPPRMGPGRVWELLGEGAAAEKRVSGPIPGSRRLGAGA